MGWIEEKSKRTKEVEAVKLLLILLLLLPQMQRIMEVGYFSRS